MSISSVFTCARVSQGRTRLRPTRIRFRHAIKALMKSLMVALAGCASLASCAPGSAQAGDPPRRAPPAAAELSHRASRPGLGWQILPNIRFAVFSEADPRRHDFVISCSGTGDVRIFLYAPPHGGRGDHPLILRSGSAAASLTADLGEDRVTPPPATAPAIGDLLAIVVGADTRLDAPALAGFLGTGRLTASWGAYSINLDAALGELALVRAMLAGCR